MAIFSLALLGFAARSGYGSTPQQRLDWALLGAAREGDAAKVEALLVKGANPNVRDRLGYTPLLLLLEGVRLKGSHASKPVQAFHRDGTATITFSVSMADAAAANSADTAAVKALIDRGSDANAANHGGTTPLMIAAGFQATDFVNALLSHGADIHAHTADGTNVLLWAAGAGHVQMLAFLLDKGLAPNTPRKSDGVTPLMLEAVGGSVSSVKMLLDHGADAYAVDKDGKTASRYAKEAQNAPVVKLLTFRKR